MTRNTKAENRVQAEAFRRINGPELELIGNYAADFRDIITGFKMAYGKIPTADDLIWIESQRCGRDITKG